MNTERIERIKLAWAILWASDTGLVRHVRSEIGRIDRDVVLNCTNIARVFSLEGHSGGSASLFSAYTEGSPPRDWCRWFAPPTTAKALVHKASAFVRYGVLHGASFP